MPRDHSRKSVCQLVRQPSLSRDSGQGTDLENCKAKFMITWVRIRAGLTDWDIAEVQKCGEGNRPETAVHRRRLAAQTPRLSEGEARLRPAQSWPTCDSAAGGLNRPKSAHRTGIRTCEGFCLCGGQALLERCWVDHRSEYT